MVTGPTRDSGFIPEDIYRLELANLLDEVLDVPHAAQANERKLPSLFFRAFEVTEGRAADQIREAASDDAVFGQLLRSGLTHMRSQTVGEATVRLTPQLPWELLIQILGEEFLLSRLAEIKEDGFDERTRLAIDTARRYATGELAEMRHSRTPSSAGWQSKADAE